MAKKYRLGNQQVTAAEAARRVNMSRQGMYERLKSATTEAEIQRALTGVKNQGARTDLEEGAPE